MIRPLCGLWFIFVHFGLQIFILLGWSVHFVDFHLYLSTLDSNFHPPGWSVHFVDFCLYPSILDMKFSPTWMIRPLCGLLFVSVHFGHVIFTYLDDSSTLWTFVCIRPFWTWNFHPLGWSVHFVDPGFIPIHIVYIIKIHVENHSCIWIFLLKENLFVEKSTCPLGLKKAHKDCSKNCSRKTSNCS